MAKKKLNKQVAAAVACVVIVLGGGGYVSYRLYENSFRPQQLAKEGRDAMLKGDYETADKAFHRAAGRGGLATNIEFLGWMYETMMHRTSMNDAALREARGLLENMRATRPNDIPTIVRKLQFDLDLLNAGGVEQFGPEQADQMKDLAAKVLAAEPGNKTGIRADATALSLPLFKQDTSQTSADVETILAELRKRLDTTPDNADVLTYYAIGLGRLRETLLREHAIEISAEDPRVKAMFTDIDTRLQTLLKSLADGTKPAEDRATGYTRAARIDDVILHSGFIADDATTGKIYERETKSLASAAAIAPPTSDDYIGVRLEQANALSQQEKMPEAETLLRDTIAAAPKSWQPRLFLADLLSDRNRASEALELVSVDLKPSSDLVGLQGYQFLMDQRQVPLRRAFYRLQNIATGKFESREKEIAAAQADYDFAIANSKVNENDPYAMQIQAAFAELKGDRTGALQTLTRALETTTNDRLKLRIQQQLVSLNLALNQPGAASTMLDQMLQNRTLTPQTKLISIIQLIDLRIRNGATEQARLLLDKAKKWMPGNPALAALEIKLMTDPEQKKKALALLPEDNAPQRFFKIKFAAELEDEPTMRRVATDALKADPGSTDVAMLWGDYLRRHDKRDEAIAVFQGAQKMHPEDKTLDLLIRDTQATTVAERDQLNIEMLKDPYKRALFDADKARGANDFDTYLKKLLEAEPLDNGKDGTATERLVLFYMATSAFDKASASIEKLAATGRDPAQIRYLKVRLALASGKIVDAIAQADSLTSDLPNFSAGWLVKGQAYQAAQQPSQASDAFETVLVQQPENVEALHGLVVTANQLGRRDVLKRYIDQGLKVTKGQDDFFVDWSLRYEVVHGDPTTTIESRIKRRDTYPNDPPQWIALAQAYLASAASKDRTGDKAAANDYRAKALDTFKQAAAKFPNIAALTLDSAKLIDQTGDADGAMKIIDGMDSAVDLSPELQQERARFYAEHGHADVAIKLLQAQIDAKKSTPEMQVQLATLQASTNNADAALRTLDTVPDAATVRELKMNILVEANRVPEAQKLVDDALAKERTTPNLLMSAMMNARQNHVPEAVKLADEAVNMEPENPAARFTRARIMLSEQPLRNNDLIADLQVVKKNAPQNLDARLLLAERLRALGRQPEATAELESMQRDFTNDRRVTTQLVQAYANETPPRYARIDQLLADIKKTVGSNAQLYSLESSVKLRRGDNKGAIDAAKQAAQLAPQDVGLQRGYMSVLLRTNSFTEAIAEADRVQKDNSSIYWTYLVRGTALHRLKREAEAAKEFDLSIGLAEALKSPDDAIIDVGATYSQEYSAEAASDWIATKLKDDATTKVYQMRLLTAAGKTDKAIAKYEQLIPQFDSLDKSVQTQVLASAGNAYLTSLPPKAENAQTVFARLNEMEPNNMMTLNNLAYAMSLTSTGASLEPAIGYAKQAYDLATTNASPNAYITDTYGWVLFKANKVDEGLAKLQEAFEEAGLAETQWHMGELYLFQAKTTDDVGQKKGYLTSATQTLDAALAKVLASKQNGETVDATLESNIRNAIERVKSER